MIFRQLRLLPFLLASVILVPTTLLADTFLVYGASGKIGGLIVEDALGRGHKVIGVSRDPTQLTFKHRKFSAVKGDVTDAASVRSLLKGVDAIVVAVTGAGEGNLPENSLEAKAARTMVDVLTDMRRAPRVLQIGGATTMFGSKENMLKNLGFPAPVGSPVYGTVFGHLIALQTYQASHIRWTVLAPPFSILGWGRGGLSDATTAKGSYRTSTTELVKNAEGKNEIYVRDLARAAVDELENKKFVGQRFTVGY